MKHTRFFLILVGLSFSLLFGAAFPETGAIRSELGKSVRLRILVDGEDVSLSNGDMRADQNLKLASDDLKSSSN